MGALKAIPIPELGATLPLTAVYADLEMLP